MSETIDYYDKNAKSFADSTADIEFSEMQDGFLSNLKEGASILDFGCGSGRDTRYFLKKGYKVTALDGSAELCRIAEEKTGVPVIQMSCMIRIWSIRRLLSGRVEVPERRRNCLKLRALK